MQVFAHRGVSAHAPENTLKGIQMALDLGVDGIEIDVIQHQGEWLVLHDAWLDRTTNGSGHIEDHSLNAIMALDAGEGESIPTLTQVLERVNGKAVLNVEVKSASEIKQLLPLLVQAQQVYGFKSQNLIVSSFNHLWLQQLRHLSADICLGVLMEGIPLECGPFVDVLRANYTCVGLSFVNKEFVEQAHRLGLQVMVYTVDRPRDLKEVKEMGADGVFSNDPAAARQYLYCLE